MKKLFALVVGLLAAVGAATVVVFWRKNHRQSWDSTLSSAKDTASSWGRSASETAHEAKDRLSATTTGVTDAASGIANELRGAPPSG